MPDGAYSLEIPHLLGPWGGCKTPKFHEWVDDVNTKAAYIGYRSDVSKAVPTVRKVDACQTATTKSVGRSGFLVHSRNGVLCRKVPNSTDYYYYTTDEVAMVVVALAKLANNSSIERVPDFGSAIRSLFCTMSVL
jgi:hypothetical protein